MMESMINYVKLTLLKTEMKKPGGKTVYNKLFGNNEIIEYIEGYWFNYINLKKLDRTN